MPESGVTKHNYLFCQFVNPARGHEGDRCDCFDTPSQRRTTLAKQRLARLRANREINRASTSNDTEPAVASDLAVTTKEVLAITRIVRARRSRLGADLVECTSGQSEDYPSHWGVYILNTVFVLLWSNGPCECAAWSVRVRSMVRAR